MLLNKEKSDGYTPLHLAACTDHHQVVQFLLDQVGVNNIKGTNICLYALV